jgi:Na+-translocating ferredoxin:NAD+ oxidoreductase subunit B
MPPEFPAPLAATPLADRIDALLPQTQCTKCGYSGCRPYAEAIATGEAAINQCPPGGAAGIAALGRLLSRPPMSLNPAHGAEKPLTVAVIDESLCTGCDLCLPPCPMDCIAMVPVQPARAWTRADAEAARRRHAERNARQATEAARNERRLAEKAVAKLAELDARDDLTSEQVTRKRSVVEAALARARARRAASSP